MIRKILNLCFLALVGCSNTVSSSKPNLLLELDEIYVEKEVRDLAVAAGGNRANNVVEIIASGVSPNSKGIKGIPVIFWPLRERNEGGLETMLQNGADPNAQWETGNSVMNLSAGLESSSFLKILLENGGNPNLKHGKTRETPIFEAILRGRENNVQLLLSAGADIESSNASKITPFLFAVMMKEYEIAVLLAENGSNVNRTTIAGFDAWYYLNQPHFKSNLSEEKQEEYSKLLRLIHKK